MIPVDLDAVTIEEIGTRFADGTLTSEALAEASLARIEERNDRINAIVFLNADAVEDARRIDRRRASGEALGPLAGVPIVVKDAMDTMGFPTTGGWRLLSPRDGGVGLFPSTDAPVVARMRSAGAVILGKTNIPVLSHTGSHANDSWAGPTLNPYAPHLVPGGSSAGSAAAVTTGMAVIGLAEETGGSIQNPAASQALVGIKPTFGLVPNAGVMPLSSLRDVIGPVARTVRDAALALDVLAGHTADDPSTEPAIGRVPDGGYAAKLSPDGLRGRRLGLYGPGWRDQPLSDETALLYERAQAELVSCGAILLADPFEGSGLAVLRERSGPGTHFDGRGLEALPHDLERYLSRLGPDAALRDFAAFAQATKAEDPFAPGGVLAFLPHLPGFAASLADSHTAPDMSAFLALRARYLELVDAVMARSSLDALVFPQRRSDLPPLHAGLPIEETTVSEINIAGIPGVTVPAGRHASGAPFGLVFVGRRWSEGDLLAYAYAYERATLHRRPPVVR